MRRVLVTGAAGFVGRHFVRHLRDEWLVQALDIVWGTDVRQWFVKRAEDQRFDLIVHCAANVGGRKAIDGNPLWVAQNLAIDQMMFEWAVKTNTRVLYFSSSAAYGVNFQSKRHIPEPLFEERICLDGHDHSFYKPDQTYGWGKLTGEYLARIAGEHVPVHVVRPFSGYGEDQHTDYPFPSFIDRALKREDPFVIWGDGGQTRDFIHIDDIVNACMAIIDQDVRTPVNLCTGVAASFNNLAQGVCNAAGYQPEFQHLLDKPVGVHFRVGDPTLLQSIYVPRISLDEGIERALKARSIR